MSNGGELEYRPEASSAPEIVGNPNAEDPDGIALGDAMADGDAVPVSDPALGDAAPGVVAAGPPHAASAPAIKMGSACVSFGMVAG